MSETATSSMSPVSKVHAARLFGSSCIALTAGAMLFAVTADIRGALKHDFLLTNAEVGLIMGTGWGFTIAMIALGPLCDLLGMRFILRLAWIMQAAGIALMISANGFWMLWGGALLTALGSGAVEAACNPLVATIYPDKKTHKLNQFHMWFPGGIVIGGLACYGLSQIGLNYWQLKLAIVGVPIAVYAVLMAGQTFPKTERVQAGISFGGMVKETLLRPLFLVLLFAMMLTASLELGPAGWIPSILEAGGVPGILVLVWITGLMAVLRYFAGPVVRVLGNTGVLLLSAVLGGAGLLALSYFTSIVMIGVAATVFALGVCYFWPTMIGTAAERVPKGGALALALLGGIGGLFVNVVTTPVMGYVIDKYLHQDLVQKVTAENGTIIFDREKETVAVLKKVRTTYTAWADSEALSPQDAIAKKDARSAMKEVGPVVHLAESGLANVGLPEPDTANALRAAIKDGPQGDPDKAPNELEKAARAARTDAEKVLNPAEHAGGLVSLRYVAPLSIVLILVFGAMWIHDRKRGGYKPEHIGRAGTN